MIAIVDYDAGNIRSVTNALNYLGAACRLTADGSEILSADGIILPGVGSFGDAMKNLDARGLVPVLKEAAARSIPFFGICLGLQLLFEGSDEEPGAGLCLLRGRLSRLDAPGLKIPHMGWSSIEVSGEPRILDGVKSGEFFYFVHSYCAHAEERDASAATCRYGEAFDAAVERGNLFGCQFHPEKSGEAGRRILVNFLKIAGEPI